MKNTAEEYKIEIKPKNFSDGLEAA